MTTPSDHPLREARMVLDRQTYERDALLAALLTLRLAVERPEYDNDPVLKAAKITVDAVLKEVNA